MDAVKFNTKIQALSNLVQLDTNRIEWEDIREMLAFAIARRDQLIGFMDADTFTFVMDSIAALGAYTQYSIDTAYGEGNLHTARLSESQRAIIRTLGVRQRRKLPSSCKVRLTRELTPPSTPALTIPEYTVFSINGNSFFNRKAVGFGNNEAEIEFDVYEGSIISKTLPAVSGDYMRYVTDEGSFAISDIDVRVFVNGQPVKVTQDPLWLYENIDDVHMVVQDGTMSSGELEIKFGNSYFGYSPAVSDEIVISYVVTRGRSGRDLQVISSGVSVQGYSNLSGTAISVVSGGDDELSGETYKNIGPMAFASQRKAVDEEGYMVVGLNFPNMVDCMAQRQAYYAPDDLRYANFIRISLLPNDSTTMTNAMWEEFVTYLQPIGLKTAKYLRLDPTPNVIDISADIYISNNLSAETVKNSILRRLETMLQPRYGILQLNIFKSDIYENISTAIPGINHVVLKSPTIDRPSKITYPTGTVTVQSDTTTMEAGSYQYYATVNTTQGESLPALIGTAQTLQTSNTQRLEVNISGVAFGSYLNLYRRFTDLSSNVTIRRIASSLPLTPQTYTDNNSTSGTVVSALPSIDNSGIWYPKLGTVLLNIYSTNRQTVAYRNVYE